MSIKISIIVPVYNAGKYLAQCLDSLINQTMREIEILCVNDGSADESLSILKKYVEKDLRVTIITQKNAGVSAARNNGILHAKGQYIMFVDADDWIDLDTCEIVWKEVKKEKADVIIWPYVREYDNRSLKKSIFNKSKIVFRGKAVERNLHRRYVGMIDRELSVPENIDVLNPVCAKIYNKQIICNNNISFHIRQTSSEDLLFNLYVFEKVKCAVYVNKFMYHYRRNDMSSQTRKYRSDVVEQFEKLHTEIFQYITTRNYSNEYYNALSNRITLSLIGLCLNVVGGGGIAYFKVPGKLKKYYRGSLLL